MNIQEQNDMEARILEAAGRVFVKKGYNQTSMNDIAMEVGIGRTALHYYFRTKEMLFEAILGNLLDYLLPNIKRVVDAEGTILDKAPLLIDEYSKALQTNLLFPVFIMTELNRNPENLYRMILKNPERIKPVLKLRAQYTEEAEKGIIRNVHPVNALSVMIGSMVFPMLTKNLLSTVFYQGDGKKLEEFIAARTPFIKEMLLHALTPVESGSDKENV